MFPSLRNAEIFRIRTQIKKPSSACWSLTEAESAALVPRSPGIIPAAPCGFRMRKILSLNSYEKFESEGGKKIISFLEMWLKYK